MELVHVLHTREYGFLDCEVVNINAQNYWGVDHGFYLSI